MYRSVVLVEWYLQLCSIMRLNHFPCFTLFILLVVQNCRGRPRLLCSVSRGSADLVENAAWCSGCCISLLKTCPRSFSILSSRISVSGLICLPGPSDGALRVSLALLHTYSLELLRCTNVVCSFRIFRKPFSWNVFKSLPAASVGSKVSKP